MRIAVDFDGTIVENQFPKVGPEKPFAIEALLRLQQAGVELILWTCRAGPKLDEAVHFLKSRGVIPDYVNETEDRHEKSFGFPKVNADYYIDDKSLPPFPGWEKFLEWAETSGVIPAR